MTAAFPPPPPYPGFAAGPPPTRPSTVNRAFVLMLTRSVLSAVGLVITLLTRGDLRARIERQQAEQQQRLGRPSPIDIDKLVDVAIVVGVTIGLLFLVFYVVLAFQVRGGRQWARVVTWVFAGLGVLGLLTQFFVAASVASRVVGTATGLIDIAVIVLLAQRPTSDFVAAMSGRRRHH